MSHPRNPQSLLTPAMRQVLHGIAKLGRPPLALHTPDQAKRNYAAGAGVLEIEPHKMARDETLHIPTRDGQSLRARLWTERMQAGLPVLIYYHGGGFTVGSPETHESLCRHLAHLAHCAVIAPDYRLAPAHRFPTAHEDAVDVLAWVRDHADALGLDATRIAIGGDSAGGTLTAATAIAARDHGWPLALQLMFYPGTSPTHMPSADTFGSGFLLEKASVDYFYGHYLSDPRQRQDPRFSPELASDHQGLAPAWIGLAECDPLVDEGVRYADVLRQAGVPVALEIYRGVVHSFIQMGRVIPEALQARQDAARALRHAFTGEQP
jgi:acetyl esterase